MSSRFPVLVFCEGTQQFRSWCHENQVSHRDPKIKYLDSADHLRSIINPQVVFYGTPDKRRDYDEVMYILRRQTRPINSNESNYQIKKEELFERIENAVRNFCIKLGSEPKRLTVNNYNYLLLKNIQIENFMHSKENDFKTYLKDGFKIYGMTIEVSYELTDEQIKVFE